MHTGRARILVLGASGSVGRALMASLGAEPTVTAIAGLRRVAASPEAGLSAADTRLADATSVLELIAAFDGMTHVINATGGPPATLRATTAAIGAAARATPGLRLIHLSSMAVYGARDGNVDENAPLVAHTQYAAAKIAAELEIVTQAERGLRAVILRPGIIHGPNSAQWTARLTRLLRAHRLGDLGAAGDGFCNLIHERDLAAACLAACQRDAAIGQTFNLGAADPPTWNDYLVALARSAGAVPVKRIPQRQLGAEARLLAPVLAAARRSFWRGAPDPIPPSLLRLFAQRIRLDVSRAQATLFDAQAAATAERLAAE
jgi:nucleoside-diphosphate-sugar epimerase